MERAKNIIAKLLKAVIGNASSARFKSPMEHVHANPARDTIISTTKPSPGN
jgi:hypothetical protein